MSEPADGHDFIPWQNRCRNCGMAYCGFDGWIVTHAPCNARKADALRRMIEAQEELGRLG